jgi:hypothetical protein
MTAAIAPLTRRQTLILAVIGAVLWLAFALLIRVLGPMGVFDGSNRIWLYRKRWLRPVMSLSLTLPGNSTA